MSYTPENLLQHLQQELPSPDTKKLQNDVYLIGELCGLSKTESIFNDDQWAKATLIVDMVKSGQAPDYATANSMLSDDDTENALSNVQTEAKSQAYRLAQEILKANREQKGEVRRGYDRLVLSYLPDALTQVRAETEKKPDETSGDSSPSVFEIALGLSPGSSSAALPEAEQSHS